MSKRLDVLQAALALVTGALPGATVRGLDSDAAKPERVPPGGMAIVRTGDPGEPDVDLSPPRYNFQHRIPVELASFEASGLTPEEALDTMMGAIGAAVTADRTLGGLCDFVEVTAPSTDDIEAPGVRAGRWAEIAIVAHYATTDPLN